MTQASPTWPATEFSSPAGRLAFTFAAAVWPSSTLSRAWKIGTDLMISAQSKKHRYLSKISLKLPDGVLLLLRWIIDH